MQPPDEPSRSPDRALALAAAAAAGVFVLALAIFPVQCDDLFYYLEAGRRILRDHALPAADPFVFPELARPWHNAHEWGTFVAARLAYLAGGWTALIAGKSALILAAFLLPFALPAASRGALPLLLPAYAGFACWAASYRFLERGSLLSDALTAAVVAAVLRARERPEETRLLPRALPLLFALWVNLHAGFLIGLLVLAAWAAAEAVEHAAARRAGAPPTRGLRDALVALALCALACLANPRGIAGAIAPLAYALAPGLDFVRAHTNEWKSPFAPVNAGLAGPYLAALALGACAATAACVRSLRRKAGLPLFELLVLALLGYLALDAVRFMLTVAFTLAVLWVPLVDRALPPWPASPGARRLRRGALGAVAAVFLLLAAKVALTGYGTAGGRRRIGTGVDAARIPVRAAAFLEENLPHGRIFNQPRFGAYLAWRWAGERPVYFHGFVDDVGHYEELLSVGDGAAGFDAVVARRGIDVFLLAALPLRRSLPPLYRRLWTDPGWRLVYGDQVAQVFVRETPENRAVVERYGRQYRLPPGAFGR